MMLFLVNSVHAKYTTTERHGVALAAAYFAVHKISWSVTAYQEKSTSTKQKKVHLYRRSLRDSIFYTPYYYSYHYSVWDAQREKILRFYTC